MFVYHPDLCIMLGYENCKANVRMMPCKSKGYRILTKRKIGMTW